jgi:hypothetical protein
MVCNLHESGGETIGGEELAKVLKEKRKEQAVRGRNVLLDTETGYIKRTMN